MSAERVAARIVIPCSLKRGICNGALVWTTALVTGGGGAAAGFLDAGCGVRASTFGFERFVYVGTRNTRMQPNTTTITPQYAMLKSRKGSHARESVSRSCSAIAAWLAA